MATMSIYFDDPFWVGVLEVDTDGKVRAVKHTFGAEPTEPEIYEFLLKHGCDLLERAERAAAADSTTLAAPRINNPKRLAREAARIEPRPSTAAQDAIRLEREQQGKLAKQDHREQRTEAARHRREVLRAKSKAKHRGR